MAAVRGCVFVWKVAGDKFYETMSMVLFVVPDGAVVLILGSIVLCTVCLSTRWVGVHSLRMKVSAWVRTFGVSSP